MSPVLPASARRIRVVGVVMLPATVAVGLSLTACSDGAGRPGNPERTEPVESEARADAVPEFPPPACRLRDLAGVEVDPFGGATAVATVFVFVRTDCPISNRYAPEIRALAERYRLRGVDFQVVYADPDETDAGIATHLDEYAFGTGALRDVDQDLARWSGARVTPEAVVFARDVGVVYRGRIDDRYRAFGEARARARRSDVDEAIAAVLGGEPPAFHATEAVGCAIRFP